MAIILAACGGDETPSDSGGPMDAAADVDVPILDSSIDGGADAEVDGGYAWNLPKNFPLPVVPADNPMTAEKVELGRHLFYDKRLSGNGMQSCASCHKQELAFTDGLPRSIGSTGQTHPRGAMSLANVAYAATLTWANNVVRELERQAQVPMFNETPIELGLTNDGKEMLAALAADPQYVGLFASAFPSDADRFTLLNVTRALASFERTLLSGNSPFDRWQQGDESAISEGAKRAAAMFNQERFECFHCHGGFAFADSINHAGKKFEEISFHNNALYNIDLQGAYPPDNTGLYELTKNPADMGRFKAPTLRNIALTAPYMHDGSIATLNEVLDHYQAGGRTITSGPYAGRGFDSPLKNEFINGFTPQLTAQERQDFLEFFQALTDDEFIHNPKFSDPFPPSP